MAEKLKITIEMEDQGGDPWLIEEAIEAMSYRVLKRRTAKKLTGNVYTHENEVCGKWVAEWSEA